MKNRIRQHSISWLSALLIFCVFAGCILSVLLSGAGAYRRLTQRDQLAYDSRTATQYIAAKIRQASSSDAVSLSEFGGEDALIIEQQLNGKTYFTRIYCHEGWLMELFSSSNGKFSPEDGEKILPVEALTMTLEDGLLSVELMENDVSLSLNLSLRGRKCGAP